MAPKKNYISLRRKKQFAMLGPATKDLLELGLNAKDLPSDPRLKALPPGKRKRFVVGLSARARTSSVSLTRHSMNIWRAPGSWPRNLFSRIGTTRPSCMASHTSMASISSTNGALVAGMVAPAGT